MKDDWREYEIAVSQLLAGKVLRWFPHLAKKDMAVYGKKKYVGSRGEYEIDASAEVLLGDVRLLFIVECKYWSSKVVQDVVLELVGKVQDLGANKGIIVSKEGFQLGAIRLARAHGIALWHFQPGRPRLFIPFVAAIDWEAVARSFETTWLRWLRGMDYHAEDWTCHDCLINWKERVGLSMSVRMATMSFWPIWVVALAFGAIRDFVYRRRHRRTG